MIANAQGQPRSPSRLMSALAVLCGCQLLLLSCGCATFNRTAPVNEDVSERLQDRKRETTERFDSNRDFAEFQAALACWQRDDVDGCEKSLARLLKRNADHCDGRLLMADVCIVEECPEDALRHAQHAVTANPDNTRAKYALALLLDSLGQNQAALAYYEQAALAEPENEVFVAGYRSAMRGASAPIAQGTTIRSVSTDTPVAADSISSDTRGQVVYRADFAGGNDSSGFVEKKSRDVAEGFLTQAAADLQRGELDRARNNFRQAVRAEPDNPDIPVKAAISALRLNQPDLAVAILQPAGELFRGSARIYRILGVAHYRSGNYKSSQVALQQALSLDKSRALSYFLMGCTLAKLGETESAEAHYLQARQLRSKQAAGR